MHTGKDPGLDDMLSDPLVVRLMNSDRIRAEDARALLAEVADRIRDQRDRELADLSGRGPRRGGEIVYA